MRRPAALALVLAGCVTHRLPLPPPTAPELISRLVEDVEAHGSLVSLYAVDAVTGAVLFAHREHARSNPASTMKLSTTAAALAGLGTEFQFRTDIALQGNQTKELFEGDVVITASGDPTLGSRHFLHTSELPDRLAAVLVARGVRRWRGHVRIVRGDLAPQDRFGPGWAWDDAAVDFGASPGPFVFRDNVAHLIVNRSAAGAIAVRIEPPIDGFSVGVTTSAAEKNEGLSCLPGPSWSAVQCSWPVPPEGHAHATAWVSVPDSRALFEGLFVKALDDAGVSHLNGDAPASKSDPEPLLSVLSPPLKEIVNTTNKESLNLCAERLAMALARSRVGVEGYVALQKAMAEDHAIRGISPADLSQVDGSGLSRYNLVSSFGLVKLLQSTLGTPYEEALLSSLPITGMDGTLHAHLLAEPARAWAKTGTLTGQRGFAGLIVRPGDHAHPTVVFALLIGNSVGPHSETNGLFDRFVEAMALAPLPARGITQPAARP